MIKLHYDPILGYTHSSIEPELKGSTRIYNKSYFSRFTSKMVPRVSRLFRTQYKQTTKRHDDN
jgi:hypothetical protein